jgi:hypothetical protein
MRTSPWPLVALSLLGCAVQPQGEPGEPGCTPGEQVSCACPKGAQGVQQCTADGTAFSACDCSGTGVGAGGWPSGGGNAGGGSAGGNDTGGVGNAGGTGNAGGGNAGGGNTGGGNTGGGGNGGGGNSGGWGGGGGWAGGSFGPVGDYAGGVAITEVAIYQGVKIPLMKNGQGTSGNAPVVAGRPALVRVFVAPGAGFSSRQLTALLDLKSSDPNVKPQTVSIQVSSASGESNLASTFNFTLPPEQVTPDLSLNVSLHEPSGTSVGTPDAQVAWPAQGQASVGAQQSGPVRLTIVPFRYNADGSGRLPDTSSQQMQVYHDIVFAMYPTNKVELELRAPVDYNYYVGPSSGWSSWLDTLCDLRSSDNVDPKQYYFGIMAPKASWSGYGGGIAGLGNVPDASGNWGRCAVGLGFTGADPDGLIMAHELGHTHGRPHAPCGVSGEPFPYSGAKIGSWGYDLLSGKLKDPGSYRDVMSYCDPQWISDVNYAKLFKRIQYINASYYVVPLPPKRYRKLLVDVDGSLHWGGSIELREQPVGSERTVTLLGQDGAPSGSVTGTFMAFGEEPAGVLLIPDPGPGAYGIAPDGMPEMVLPPG